MSRRQTLKFNTEDDVIADVQKLRKGYQQAGAWNLPQVCWHLNVSVQTRMKPGPFPPNTPEQDARKAQIQQILAAGRLPDGIPAPEASVPPPDAGDAAIETLLASLQTFKTFTGRIPPHRIFGNLNDADARKLNLIHCAHHLSYLSPVSAGS
ncbi:MAG: DUF1569 domain-containing protein [Phycisphaerales bacterium]|jgi:hypothetical protein|nr:DUF1569 domain-containing protein [Phycisphaerales bacterium]